MAAVAVAVAVTVAVAVVVAMAVAVRRTLQLFAGQVLLEERVRATRLERGHLAENTSPCTPAYPHIRTPAQTHTRTHHARNHHKDCDLSLIHI